MMKNIFIKRKVNSLELNNFQSSDSKDREPTVFRLKDKPVAVRQWQRYIEQAIGFVLPKEQSQWLLNAVEHTAAENMLSLAQLWDAVQIDKRLKQQLIDTVLIPESRFFRHEPSIAFVTALAHQYCIQPLQSTIQGHSNNSVDSSSAEPFRIWSVGCATGQEVWSLAMSLAAKNISNHKILGSDVSQKALNKARKGQYDQRQQQLIPSAYQHFMQPLAITTQDGTQAIRQSQASLTDQALPVSPKLLLDRLLPSKTSAYWRVMPELHEQVSFVWHNIFTPSLATSHLQQVILCQNVLIYFRQFDQRDILTRLSAQCALGGHIVLAPGEALFWRPSNMRRIAHSQVNAWQKISA
ncbi:CheR family methyltransferase [Psychrobacter sp. P11G5]|uniref:CheR family methyltransferase n=1 Tax=Psychrobacter sp. P11G5 TaxID=1699624 RepID=UPI000B3356E4|nr:CheR family methyltransferase [Psychrobacter sp. P11G5]